MNTAFDQPPRIAIVGGGLAGLHAAWHLAQRGVAFELLEARSRWGGRILSASESGLDLGPTWFWPGFQPRISRLLEALEIPVFAQYQTGDTLVEHWNGQVMRHDAPLMAERSMRIDGGTSRLVEALLSRIPQAHRHLDTRIQAVHLQDDGLSLTTGTNELRGFDQVWLALPPRLVQGIRFVPALPPKAVSTLQGSATWMAAHAKYVAVYPEAFWRGHGLGGNAFSQVGPLREIHDASLDGHPALFGFFGTPHHERMLIGNAQLLLKCRAQLARLFGDAALQPIAEHFHDWAADPLTATTHDHANGHEHGILRTEGLFDGAWAGRLQLIGSEADHEQPGYMEGALQDITRLLARRP